MNLRLTALVFAGLAVLAAGPAHAASPAAEHEAVRRDVQAGRLKPLAEILEAVQKRHPGRVLDVDLERGTDGRRWYEIKVLGRDGNRVEIHVDAVTGNEIRRPEAPDSALLPMATVLRAVLATHPGTVLEVELEMSRGDRPVYELNLLNREGREIIVRIDALSGQMIDLPPIDRRTAAELVPLPGIVEELERRYAGRATEAELKRGPGRRLYYEIDLHLSSGRNVEVHVDATTGRLLAQDELR